MEETPKKEHTNTSPPGLTGRKAARELRLFENKNSPNTNEALDTFRSPSHERCQNHEAVVSTTLKRSSIAGVPSEFKELRLYAPRLDSPFDEGAPIKPTTHRRQRLQSDSMSRDKANDSGVVEPLTSLSYFPKGRRKDDQLNLIELREDVDLTLGGKCTDKSDTAPHAGKGATHDIQSLRSGSPEKRRQSPPPSTVTFANNDDVHEFVRERAENLIQENAANQDSQQHNSESEGEEDFEQFPVAVELTPFKNKVGGHTAIFRFSHRAVCKALVNRENDWYEAIEKSHADILNFMPKYIGVLNVRYAINPTINEMSLDQSTPPGLEPVNEGQIMRSAPGSLKMRASSSYTEDLPPEVVLGDNRHIISDSLWTEISDAAPSPPSSLLSEHSPRLHSGNLLSSPGVGNSSGATLINTKLKDLVLSEVFDPKQRHKKPGLKHTRSSTSPRLLAQRTASAGYPRPHRLSASSSDLGRRPKFAEEPLKKSHSSLVDLQNMTDRAYQESPRPAGVTNDSVIVEGEVLESPVSHRATKSLTSEADSIFQMDDEDGQSSEQRDARHGDDDSLSDTVSPLLMARDQPKHRLEEFILLEDLTSGMKKASVLDLKMGTRQYGVEANLKKKKSQRKKCAETTSRLLGVRICGLQSWDKKKSMYIARDKYFGREVRAGVQFAACLARFLYDGETVYSILVKIPKLLEDLDELEKAVQKLSGYRLYGSSLLLMYDGANGASIKMNIIDFAQCITPETQLGKDVTFPPKHMGDPDNGYLRGLKSVKFYLNLVYSSLAKVGYSDGESARAFVEQNEEELKQSGVDWLEAFDHLDKLNNPELDQVPQFARDDVGNVSE